ncbi:MAG: SBBP repeat-containing protein [Desulfurococcales archaeon]|nr:SBBP repeat-containing protein [Desulfurococcales archaeon]
MRSIVAIVLVGILLLPMLAQVGYAANPFTLVYGGPEYEASLGVTAGRGGVYTVGTTNSTTVPGDDADGFVARHMASGIIEWVVLLNMSTLDIATGLALDDAGNVYVVGSTQALGPDTDLFVAFLSSDGVLGWVLVFNDTLYRIEASRSIYMDRDYVYLVGSSYDGDDSDVIVAKIYRSNWTVAWAYVYGEPYTNETGTGIIVDSSGNIYVSGHTNTTGIPGLPPSGNINMLLYMINPDGSLNWSKVVDLPPSQYDYTYNLDMDEYGHIYVVGEARETVVGNDIVLAKLYPNGTIQWIKRIDYLDVDEGFNIDYENGMIYLTGAGYQPPPWDPFSSKFDVYVLSTYPNGTLDWFKVISGPSIEWGLAVDALPSGGVYVSGFTGSYGAGNLDAFLAYLTRDTTVYTWCAGDRTWSSINVTSITNATVTDATYTLIPYDPVQEPIELVPDNVTAGPLDWTPQMYIACSPTLVGGESTLTQATTNHVTTLLAGILLLAAVLLGRRGH